MGRYIYDIELMTSTYIKTKLERCCMTEDESDSEGLMERQTTGEDRVRMTAGSCRNADGQLDRLRSRLVARTN